MFPGQGRRFQPMGLPQSRHRFAATKSQAVVARMKRSEIRGYTPIALHSAALHAGDDTSRRATFIFSHP
jgi:hypothetical protein